MEKENMLTGNIEDTGKIKALNFKATNGKVPSFGLILREMDSKFTLLNNEIVLLLNTMSTKLVFATRDTLYRSILKMPFGLKKLQNNFALAARSERGDVPGWVLVVLMTTGLVTGIWTVAQPRLSSILKNSLDNMNSIR
jgi:hypothetical protein